MSAWEHFGTAFSDNSPIYSQIIALFSRSFARGEIKTGERIPSIRDMAMHLKVNAGTMQRVYQEMEREGLIGSKRGTGYFFTEEGKMIEKIRRNLAQDSLRRFVDEMRALGCQDREILEELKLFMKEGVKHA